jgi:hypothetical protein
MTMNKKQFVAYYRKTLMPSALDHERHTGRVDYPLRRQLWNDAIDAGIRNGILNDRAGDWAKPADIEGRR